jgi:hypothetical protein
MTTFRRAAFLGLSFSVLAMPSVQAAAKSAFDGTWAVIITTTSGGCDPTYRYVLHVADGVVSPDAKESSGVIDISGKVDSSGQVKVRVGRGQQHANGTGKLAANAGAGTWTGSSASEACAGRWEAKRS